MGGKGGIAVDKKKGRSGVPSSSQLPRCVASPATLPKSPVPRNYSLGPCGVKSAEIIGLGLVLLL